MLVSTLQQATAAPAIEHGNEDGTDQLPSQVCGRIAHICPWLMLPAFTPKVRNMVCPVNSSEPHDNHQR